MPRNFEWIFLYNNLACVFILSYVLRSTIVSSATSHCVVCRLLLDEETGRNDDRPVTISSGKVRYLPLSTQQNSFSELQWFLDSSKN
jgi:hypothetical protein